MEQNPVSILVVLAGMAFLFLGLMQYIVTMMKSNDTTRNKLIEENILLKQAKADLQIERDELADDLKKYRALVKKYYALAKHLYDDNVALRNAGTVTEVKKTATTTVTEPPKSAVNG